MPEPADRRLADDHVFVGGDGDRDALVASGQQPEVLQAGGGRPQEGVIGRPGRVGALDRGADRDRGLRGSGQAVGFGLALEAGEAAEGASLPGLPPAVAARLPLPKAWPRSRLMVTGWPPGSCRWPRDAAAARPKALIAEVAGRQVIEERAETGRSQGRAPSGINPVVGFPTAGHLLGRGACPMLAGCGESARSGQPRHSSATGTD